jgi:hypothetical protein
MLSRFVDNHHRTEYLAWMLNFSMGFRIRDGHTIKD